MAYSIKEVAATLKAARVDKGLSQRGLAELAGAPQSHISKIENGAVDLRLSSLVEIARALDLEVMLVPQKNLSAVQSIVRRDSRSGKVMGTDPAAATELQRIQNALSLIARQYPNYQEVAQVRRNIHDMSRFQLPGSYLPQLKGVRKALRNFSRGGQPVETLRSILNEIQRMRNELAHSVGPFREADRVRPAYSLEEDNHG